MGLKTVNDVVEFYRRVIEASGLQIGTNADVLVQSGKGAIPVQVAKLPLVLPTQARLTAGLKEELAFAPLGEALDRVESDVLKWLRRAFTVRQTSVAAILFTELAQLAAETERHKTLSPDQAELLSVLPEADETMVKAFVDLFDVICGTGDKKLISTYVGRNKVLDGAEWLRAALVSFDVLKAKVTKEHAIYGKKMRVKDKKAFFDLLQFILPGALDPERFYSAGSRDKTAPNFHCLLTSYIKVMRDYNRVIELYSDVCPDLAEWTTPHLDQLEQDLTEFRELGSLIPPLAGNKGEGEESKVTAVNNNGTLNKAATSVAPVTTPVSTEAPKTWASAVSQPPAYQAPVAGGYQSPNAYTPSYHQAPVQAAPLTPRQLREIQRQEENRNAYIQPATYGNYGAAPQTGYQQNVYQQPGYQNVQSGYQNVATGYQQAYHQPAYNYGAPQASVAPAGYQRPM